MFLTQAADLDIFFPIFGLIVFRLRDLALLPILDKHYLIKPGSKEKALAL